MSRAVRPCPDRVAMSSTPILTRHLLVRLQQDWDHLKVSPDAVEQARGWCLGASHEPGRSIESLDDVLRWSGYGLTAAHNGDPDQTLAQLVRLAAFDQLAARVVLQRLLPGISTLARRRSTHERPLPEVLDEIVASAWTVIRTYPVQRRCSFVAAGMLREIDYQTFQRARRRLTTFVPSPMQTFEGRPAPLPTVSAVDELRQLLDEATAAGLDPDDIELARQLGRGESTSDIARARQVTDRTVRNHRRAMTYRLRAVALAAS